MLLILLLGLGVYLYHLRSLIAAREEFHKEHQVEISTSELNPEMELYTRRESTETDPSLSERLGNLWQENVKNSISPPDPLKSVTVGSKTAFREYVTLFDASKIEQMYLERDEKNPITDSELQLLHQMPNLTFLSIGDIPITANSLDAVARLPKLNTLLLNSKEVTGKGVARLRNSASLKTLWIGNSLSDDDLWNSLLQLPNLESYICDQLELTEEHILKVNSDINWIALGRLLGPLHLTDVGMQNLKYFKKLKRLNLSGSDISDESLAVLSHLTNLEDLSLSNTKITSRGIVSLKNLPNLRYLHLDGTNINSDAAETLQTLPSLQLINLSNTVFDDTGIKRLTAQQKIRDLILERTRITENVFEDLNRMQLSTLAIGYCHISSEGLRNLQPVDSLSLQGLQFTREDIQHLFTETTAYTELNLTDSSWSDDLMDLLTNLKSCNRLNLSRTAITTSGLNKLTGSTNANNNFRLDRLILNNLPISLADIDVLKLLCSRHKVTLENCGIDDQLAIALFDNSKQMINLPRNPITDDGLRSLLNENITYINLSGTQVTDEGMKLLEPLNLTYLLISDTAVTDASIPYLNHFEKLGKINLDGTAMTPQGKKELLKQYPYIIKGESYTTSVFFD
ncbi:MAG: hypothetical protein R3C11_08905 [Planctomycetaceae bacterium]